MSDQNTLDEHTHAQLIPCLEQAARIAQRRADRHAGREEWADAVQWSDLHGRIMQVVFDLPLDLATDADQDQAAPTGSMIDLLQAAERILHDLPTQGRGTAAIAPHLGVDLLDLIREVGARAD